MESGKKLISVVTPCYNELHTVRRLLRDGA